MAKSDPTTTPADFATPYAAGYDYGLHGANETNWHFGWFSCEENTRAWERGAAESEGQ